MPKFTIVPGSQSQPDSAENIENKLRELQDEIGGQLCDVFSLRLRKSACELAIARGIDCAIIVLQQELRALAEIGGRTL